MNDTTAPQTITGAPVQDSSYLSFLQSLDIIHQSLRKAEDIDQMMKDVLDTVLSIFDSDRAWLLFPCDPSADSWDVPMERTRPGYPGALAGGVSIPMLPEAIDIFSTALEAGVPVTYDPDSGRNLPAEAARQFTILSQMNVVIHPRKGRPWLLGMHQCSHARIWTKHEQLLFHEIGRRIADALNTMLLLQELQKSEEKYRSVVDNSPDLIYRADTNGMLTFVSPAVHGLLGYTAEEAIGMNLAKDIYVNPEDRQRFLEHTMASGSIERFHFQVRHKDGSVRWASTNAKLMEDEHGQIVGIEGVTRNITEQKLDKIALSQSKTYLRTVIDTLPDLVWLKDEKGRYLFCNSKFESLYGASEEIIQGKTDYDFVPKELADFFRKHDQIAMDAGGPSKNEEEVTFAEDGHVELLETIKTPMYDADGKLIGVLGIARDMTDLKLAEENRKELEKRLKHAYKMEAIGTISGGIAHDFNNILGIIIGNTELAFDGLMESDPARQNLEEIKMAGMRAADIVRQLLNYSRKTKQDKAVIDIVPVVKESARLLRSSIPASVEIHLDIPEWLPFIEADSTQIQQMFLNLCTNASHAMEERGGTLTISAAETTLTQDTVFFNTQPLSAGNYIQFSIDDTGNGIDQDTLGKIFDPYFTTKAIGKGTGMGLAIVHGIVTNHHGGITVSSEPGRGTRFKVLLPLATKQPAASPPPAEELSSGSETVLLVDDEESLLQINARRLKQLGYTVITEKDPRQALERVKTAPEHIDIIVTDMTMPHMTGERLITEVMKIRPDLPVILCTGYSNRIDKKSALAVGATEYLEKPFETSVLAKAIHRVLSSKAAV